MDAFSLFPTPVFVIDVPGADLAARHLVPELLEERAREPGIAASNEGGTWHSVPDLARRDHRGWDSVAQLIVGRVREVFEAVGGASDAHSYRLQMWATVMPPGGYAVLHDHSTSHWSVAIWLDAGDADLASHPRSGVLAFVDPRRVPPSVGGVELYPPVFSVQPRTGAMVVFPGWLQHFVHPYRGERPRICVSANVQVE